MDSLPNENDVDFEWCENPEEVEENTKILESRLDTLLGREDDSKENVKVSNGKEVEEGEVENLRYGVVITNCYHIVSVRDLYMTVGAFGRILKCSAGISPGGS